MRASWILATAALSIFSAAYAEHQPVTTPDQPAFEQALIGNWRNVFSDSCTGDWTDKWFLDGRPESVVNTPAGMVLTAGSQWGNDAGHLVLWTKESFAGDLRIDYEFTRLDSEIRAVNILYVQATGSGVGPYKKDITEWTNLRRVPAMKNYFNHMNVYHISYAAFENDGVSSNDYVRARRYIPEKTGLNGTELLPDYSSTGLFATGVPHRITVIKRDQDLYMRVCNNSQTHYFHWRNDRFPPITEGRIGLRLMYTRTSLFRNVYISTRGSLEQ